jgi:hypothetical protein
MKRLMTEVTHNTNTYFAPADENFVTDLVPSEIACLANSPGRISRTDV